MVITKEKIQKQIDAMPDQFDTEELMERIMFVAQVEEGLKDIAEGRIISHDEAKKRMAKWLQ